MLTVDSRYTFEARFQSMPDISAQVEIPNRALFKAAEVCDILKVQPYVLRSWEAEFPELGVAKTAGAPRVYRRKDVEQVARIKHLLLIEGLTLAGARRKLEEEAAPVAADAPTIDELIGQNARERLTTVKRGLRSILELLASNGGGLRAPAPKPTPSRVRPIPVSRTKTSLRHAQGGSSGQARGKVAASRRGPARSTRARRKRSA
jgi:DNA-binding transcriptional MerR regulator